LELFKGKKILLLLCPFTHQLDVGIETAELMSTNLSVMLTHITKWWEFSISSISIQILQLRWEKIII